MKVTLDKSKKTILFYQPDRYKKPNAKEAEAHFEQHVPCNFLVALTWEDFVAKLDLNPDLVGFHSDMFDHQELRISALIATVQATLKLKNKSAKISVAVNNNTSIATINKLKKHNITGIQLGRGHNGIDRATESWRELLNRDGYWPEDFISRLSTTTTTKPFHIYFRDNMDLYMTLEMKQYIMKDIDVDVRHCKSFSELSEALHDQPTSISFHIDMVRRHGGTISEFMMMLETMMKYSNLTTNPTICVAIEADTHISTIKELQKHKIFGIIPGAKTIGVEYTRTAITDIINKIPHWPKDVISRLPGNENKKEKTSHSLTDRQQEVFDLIAKRGLSNKQIARVLNISESTVKIHVSAVMKNLCVRNRTQLALTK